MIWRWRSGFWLKPHDASCNASPVNLRSINKVFGETATMKSVLIGAIAAIVIALGAYAVLDMNVQRTAEQRFTTEGVRL